MGSLLIERQNDSGVVSTCIFFIFIDIFKVQKKVNSPIERWGMQENGKRKTKVKIFTQDTVGTLKEVK